MRRMIRVVTTMAIVSAPLIPAHAQASTRLIGYGATAQAAGIRIEVFDPTLPIPANPEGDVGVGFTRSSILTGPTARALATYLWPGDAVGDGLPSLTGTSLDYPVKINSRYPATSTAPRHNAAQLTDGNGATTFASGAKVRSNVNAVDVDGTDLLGSPGEGLCQLFGQSCATHPTKGIALPAAVAGAATMTAVHSHSVVNVGSDSVEATAQTSAAGIRLIGGLITIGGIDVTSSSTSDGHQSVNGGSIEISDLKIAGQRITLAKKLTIGGHATTLPTLPEPLAPVGVTVSYAQQQNQAGKSDGSLDAQGLVITINTHPLLDSLHLSTVTGPLGNVLDQIPTIGSQVSALLGLAPKIEIVVGDTVVSSNASPPYSSGTSPSGGVSPSPPTSTGGDTAPGTTSPTVGSPVVPGAPITTTGPTGGSVPDLAPTRPAALSLPGLNKVPAAVLLVGLAAVLALGWLLRFIALPLFGAAGSCSYGLRNAIPDLREGRGE